MCTAPHLARGLVPSAAIRREPAAAPADPVTLAASDDVTLTTLVDNNTDLLLADQGPSPARYRRPAFPAPHRQSDSEKHYTTTHLASICQGRGYR